MKHYEEGARWYDILSPGMPGDVPFYLGEAKKSKGRVLELACGTGRIYLELLNAGVDAYGLDLSGDMLAVLKGKAKARKLWPKVKLADMRTFHYPFKFGLIIIPYNSFLHLESREDQKKCLENVRRHLGKGGKLIITIFDPRVDFLAQVDRRITEHRGKRLEVESFSHYDLVNQHIRSYHRLVNPPGGMPSEKLELSLCYIFPREFMNMLELCGFRKWKVYGGFDRRPYNKHGQNLVWIAYK